MHPASLMASHRAAKSSRSLKRRAQRALSRLGLPVAAGCLVVGAAAAADVDNRGVQFISWSDFSAFQKTEINSETVLTSPQITTRIGWNQLIPSWNAELPAEGQLKFEVRALYPEHSTKFYTMALWSGDPERNPRKSLAAEQDADGHVATDTLILKQPCQQVQLRVTLVGTNSAQCRLKFLSVCLTDTNAAPPALEPNRKAWGKLIPVPERSQMLYPDGKNLCSPTTVSMLLSHWSRVLKRKELDQDVPAVVHEIYDPGWQGTGNWSFNMAYPGSFPALRAYVTRLTDVSELEDWISSGIPVGLSVCYNKLRGYKDRPPSGHLVVCVGFTEQGDPIINDPGTTLHVRKTFKRADLVAAWANSHNAVYLIYPENSEVPKDRFGHWSKQ